MSQPPKLLLVDDIPANLTLLIDYLTKSNYQLFVAENGPSALERLRYLQPDLILLDVLMPEMSGFEVCKAIKANPQTRHIPVIFLTAREETADKLKGFAVGGVDYITKPLVEAEVLARVHTHLQLAQRQHRLSTENFQLHQQLAKRGAEPSRHLFPIVAPTNGNPIPTLRLTLFGAFQLTIGDRVCDTFRSDLVRALLTYLVLEGQTPIDRAWLAEFFWPAYLPHTRLNSLRVALHNLRQLLAPVDHLLVTDRKTIWFQSESTAVWCDALALERDTPPLFPTTRAYPTWGVSTRSLAFLPGFEDIDSPGFQEWREQRQIRYAILATPLT